MTTTTDKTKSRQLVAARPSDYFSTLPRHIQDEGWATVPHRFLLEDQHILTDRQFLVLVAALARANEAEPIWKPEPRTLALDLKLQASAVSASISKVTSIDLGFVRTAQGAVDATCFWSRYKDEQFARIPWVWLQVHYRLDLSHRAARVLMLLAALWNPRTDARPFLSQRFLAQVLKIDRSSARRSLQALPEWVTRTYRPGARGYDLRGLTVRLVQNWAAVTGTDPNADGADEDESGELRLETEVQPGIKFRELLESDFHDRLVESGLVPIAPSAGMRDIGGNWAKKFASSVDLDRIQAMRAAHPNASPGTIASLLVAEFGDPVIRDALDKKIADERKLATSTKPDAVMRAPSMAQFRSR